MKVNEAFEILKNEGVTKNIESVRRWIRQGELKATLKGKNRNSGYDVSENDLQKFIFSKMTHEEAEKYKQRKKLEKEIGNYKDTLDFVSKKVMTEILTDPEYKDTLTLIKESGGGTDFLLSLIKPSVKTAMEIIEDSSKMKEITQQKEGE